VPKFAANLDWMFRELPFLERFGAAAEAGFKGVEFLFPYGYPPAAIADALRRHRLTNVLFNVPAGDWAAGERGIAALPGRESEFLDSLELAISYALALKTDRLHVLAGVVPTPELRDECRAVYLDNLRHAAGRAATHGITLLVEALNPIDVPAYLVRTQAESFEICAAAKKENIRMQIDLYHMQMTEGNLATGLRRYHAACSHIQIAGVPGRNEPYIGEINYPYLFGVLGELGYDGWIGCEYQPRGDTVEGIAWYRRQ